MKNTALIFFCLITFSLSAQISFRTGNSQLDIDLNVINSNASSNYGVFKKDMIVTYNVPEKKIDHMRMTLNMVPGEIYLLLEIFKITRRPLDDIFVVYKRDKNKGWGYIAKQMGIKPGSPQFHQLKNNAGFKKNQGKGKSGAKANDNVSVKLKMNGNGPGNGKSNGKK